MVIRLWLQNYSFSMQIWLWDTTVIFCYCHESIVMTNDYESMAMELWLQNYDDEYMNMDYGHETIVMKL